MTSNDESQTTSSLENSKIGNQFNGIINTLSTFRTQITALSAQVRALEKEMKRVIKVHKKEAASKKNRVKRAPSGFAKPAKISDALCDFMSRDHGSQMARTDVTKYIINYIKTENLQKQENKKVILPDNKLKELLGCSDNDEVTYFNLQRYMNKHFVKKEAENEKSS